MENSIYNNPPSDENTLDETNQIYADSSDDNEGEEYDDRPLALIVEDDKICQNFLENQLKEMNIDSRIAETVNEAKQIYLDITKDGLSIDVIFLDIYLRDNSTGIQFLEMIKKNNWMENALIIVMSGIEDNDIVMECYNYKIQNFIRKPVTKTSFMNESFQIKKHLDSLKCPLPNYKFIKYLGAGTSAKVDLVRHKKTKELFALKTVPLICDAKLKKKREHEGRMYKNAKCPTVLELKEYKIEDNQLYLVLEYAENGTVGKHIIEKINKKEHFSVNTILDWAAELFLGLFYLHSKGLLHRDIKSDNLFICKDNVLKIGDLGEARATDNPTKTLCGTISYMAPEVFNHKGYYSAVDIWSAGVVLYELIMLEKPFTGNTTEEIQKKIQSAKYPPLAENTDERLKKLVECCIDLDAFRRYSAAEILCMDFIAARLKKLIDTKVLVVNSSLYNKIMSLIDPKNPIRNNQPDKEEIIDNSNNKNPEFIKLRESFNNYKLAFKIDWMSQKSSYKTGMFSAAIHNLIKGSDLEACASDFSISNAEMEKLIKENILVDVIHPENTELDFSDDVYYQMKLYEDNKIDNSLMFPVEIDSKRIIDPVILTIECLAQADTIFSKLKEIEYNYDDDQKYLAKCDLISSQDFVSFLYDIKKLQFLHMSSYSSKQKLAIILNIYQTMYIHYMIKNILYSDAEKQKGGILDSLKSFVKKNSNTNEVVYQISNQTISLYEMKHIVIRRNRKPLDAYFRLVNNSDPRISFIDEDDSMLMKLHIICMDPISLNEECPYEPKFIQFRDVSVMEQIEEFCKNWVAEFVKKEEKVLFIPKFLKDYITDFGGNEQDLIKNIFKIHNDPNLKATNILKLIATKGIYLNYY